MTDEARMADDGCTQEPDVRMPTRAEVEAAIVKYAEATERIHFGAGPADELVPAFVRQAGVLRGLLDRIPWGEA